MALTPKGQKILSAMKSEYGASRGTSVFYASEKKGTISGVHKKRPKHRKTILGG